MRAELQSVLDSVGRMSAEDVPQLLGDLEVIRATALMRLSGPTPAPQHDQLLGVEAAAERLGISTNRLYRHSKKYPFTRRDGRSLLFSSLGIDAYIGKKRT